MGEKLEKRQDEDLEEATLELLEEEKEEDDERGMEKGGCGD